MKVYILRGHSGCGKSTYAKSLKEKRPELVIVSTDEFFMQGSKYVFDARKLGYNHQKCYNAFIEALCYRKDVVVDNTNIKLSEIKKYLDAVQRINSETNDIYLVDVVTVQYNNLDEAIKFRQDQPDDKNVPEDKIILMENNLKLVTDESITSEYPKLNIQFSTITKSPT